MSVPMTPSEQARYEKLRAKHGAQLQRVEANKGKIKEQGTVKSWMEVFVLMNDQHPKFTAPLPQQHPDLLNKRVNKHVAAGLIVPPNVTTTPHHQQQHAVQSPVLQGYSQLPTPQNPKLVLATDRRAYDNALDAQLDTEIEKLAKMKVDNKVTFKQMQSQTVLIDQLRQQKEMVDRQKAQNANAKQKMKAKPIPAAAIPVEPPKTLTLEEKLKHFFAKHEPEALVDGRVEAVLMWTEERGEDKLNAMLREQYGRDLNGQLNVESTFVDQVQADRIARRLHGFYRAKGVSNMPESECVKIGEWACKAGEAALNTKLRAKYNDDLDSFAQAVMLEVEPKLRKFYMEKNPEMFREKGIGPLLTWTVSNGIPALNNLLMEKYGEDLQGNVAKKRMVEEKSEFISSRQVMYRSMQRERAATSASVLSDNEADILNARKELLIKQLSSFLEVKDPRRLTQGGLVPLVQWALPRTDKQVDELLTETYGADLEEAGLRQLDFPDEEVSQWGKNDDVESLAFQAGRVVSAAMEDEFARAEIRSTRENPTYSAANMFDDEPDF